MEDAVRARASDFGPFICLFSINKIVIICKKFPIGNNRLPKQPKFKPDLRSLRFVFFLSFFFAIF